MDSPDDKKCRICGYADVNNVNIFSEAHKSLVNKIRTVFPILIYKNDPLPKNICKKCTATVSFMYVDIQRVMKLQHKWIHNVRCNAPDDNYLCILNMIEMANRGTRQTIKTVLSEDIFMEWIDRVALALPPLEKPTKQQFKNSTPQNTASTNVLSTSIPQNVATNNNNNNNNSNSNINSNDDSQQNCNIKFETSESTTATNKNNEKLHDLKSLLASNGCTLLAVQNKKRTSTSTSSTSHAALERETKTRRISNTKMTAAAAATTVKQEAISDDVEDENIVLSKRISRQTCAKKSTNTNALGLMSTTQKQQQQSNIKGILLASPTINNKCPLCTLTFESEKELAIHQVTHMRLQIPRIFDRKCLSKKERRGRLIVINDKQCIRCLNCWRIFNDNKSILTHWTMSNCAFYCQICGKEFAHAPKMLREHVPAAHGVNYRSTKLQHQRFAPLPEESEIIMDTSKRAQDAFLVETEPKTTATTSSGTTKSKEKKCKEKKKTVQEDKRAACPICSTWFQNMKARNSHMRKHKIKHKVENNSTVVRPASKEEEIKIPLVIKTEPTNNSVESLSTAAVLPNGENTQIGGTKAAATTVPTTVATSTLALISDITVSIKTEPLDIDDNMMEKCEVCQQFLNGALKDHTCF